LIVDPQSTDPVDVYKLLIGAIVPRPIAFVSTVSLEGVRNLAAFSFFTAISANPPVVCFSPMVRGSGTGQAGQKDTLSNAAATREFVVNIVSEDFAEKMNLTAPEFPPEVDEFEVSGLTPIPSDLVRPPRVAESRVSMECKLIEIVAVSAKPLGGSLVIGEVLRFHVADAIVENFRIDPDQLHAVGRMAGNTYVRTTDRFDMIRPKA
jgi:flavin reductase (DIM6/NTAB) family NADH-FMN oxidoreductase RutF